MEIQLDIAISTAVYKRAAKSRGPFITQPLIIYFSMKGTQMLDF